MLTNTAADCVRKRLLRRRSPPPVKLLRGKDRRYAGHRFTVWTSDGRIPDSLDGRTGTCWSPVAAHTTHIVRRRFLVRVTGRTSRLAPVAAALISKPQTLLTRSTIYLPFAKSIGVVACAAPRRTYS